jgi:hypothetical protein
VKRSEMIEHINTFLEKNGKFDSFGKRVLATQFLSFIEGLGMLPPPYTFEQEVVNNPTGDTISVINYDWEIEQ